MIIHFLYTALCLFGLYYLFFILRIYIGLHRLPNQPTTTEQPFISVVIPARNEEANISHCLDALVKQNYPSDKCEFIVVDDNSTDRTVEIVRDYQKRDKRFSIYTINTASSNITTGKSQKHIALNQGIGSSRGEIILLTDADSEPLPTWISSMVSMFVPEVVYVSGPVVEASKPNFFLRLRALEYFGFMIAAAGRIGHGSPTNVSGANVAFRKSTYYQTGGFNLDAKRSNEETLMLEIHKSILGKIAHATHPKAKVATYPEGTLRFYWQQRLRWGSMQNRYALRSVYLELTGVYLAFLFWMVSLFLSPFFPTLFIPVATFFVLKSCVDFATVNYGSNLLESPFRFTDFLICEVLHIPSILVVIHAAQILPHRWKGRSIPIGFSVAIFFSCY
jgi:cellulose synthase/poly-beta-1,6-N-acetylglucosamine synthase-like glycosyltransferase